MSHPAPTETNIKMVPFSSIEADMDLNVRKDYDPKHIKDLAASIKAEGLLSPLLVTKNGGDAYKLVGGFNRFLALKELRWGQNDVPVVIKKDAPLVEVLLDNIAHNIHKGVHPADVAKRLSAMESGYAFGADDVDSEEYEEEGEDGEEAEAVDTDNGTDAGASPAPVFPGVDRDRLSKATGLSKSHIGNLVRCDRGLTEKVKKAWRKYNISLHHLLEWVKMTAEEQDAALASWIDEYKDSLDESGEGTTKKRRKAKGKEKKTDKEESSGPSRANIRSQLESLRELEASGEVVGATDVAFLRGKIAALRFAAGEVGERVLSGSYKA